MSEHDDFTPEEVAFIEARIEQGFTFLQDVLDNPAITEVVPGGSEFRFQELVTGATTFHLIAFRPQDAREDPWVARIIKPAEYANEHRGVARPEDVPGAGGNQVTRPVVGDTADAALDALATKLRKAQPRLLEAAVADRQTA
jgi:hypothetical protein